MVPDPRRGPPSRLPSAREAGPDRETRVARGRTSVSRPLLQGSFPPALWSSLPGARACPSRDGLAFRRLGRPAPPPAVRDTGGRPTRTKPRRPRRRRPCEPRGPSDRSPRGSRALSSRQAAHRQGPWRARSPPRRAWRRPPPDRRGPPFRPEPRRASSPLTSRPSRQSAMGSRAGADRRDARSPGWPRRRSRAADSAGACPPTGLCARKADDDSG